MPRTTTSGNETIVREAHAKFDTAWRQLAATDNPATRARLLGACAFEQDRIVNNSEFTADTYIEQAMRYLVLRVLADVEYAIVHPGRGRRWTDTVLEHQAGAVLDQMAETTDPTARRAALADLAVVLEGVGEPALDVLRSLPAPGYLGWQETVVVFDSAAPPPGALGVVIAVAIFTAFVMMTSVILTSPYLFLFAVLFLFTGSAAALRVNPFARAGAPQ